MKLSDFQKACAVLLVAVVGCTSGTSPVITAATDRAAKSLPDFENTVELDEALFSFGECVEESFPIVMRFRSDPFLGLSTEVSSQREEDGELVERVVADCNGQFDLDRRIGVYRGEHPASPAVQRELLDEFVSCVSDISSEASDRVARAKLESIASIDRFVIDLRPGSGLETEDLFAVTECMEDVTGPEHVFSEGHPWFTP